MYTKTFDDESSLKAFPPDSKHAYKGILNLTGIHSWIKLVCHKLACITFPTKNYSAPKQESKFLTLETFSFNVWHTHQMCLQSQRGACYCELTVDLVAVQYLNFAFTMLGMWVTCPFNCQPLHYWLCCCGEFLEKRECEGWWLWLMGRTLATQPGALGSIPGNCQFSLFLILTHNIKDFFI